jgi:hypothetical protein
MDLVFIHLLTHSFTRVFHTVVGLNLGSELGFYLLPTVLLCGYYYYLYIYKSRFQADHLQIRVSSLSKTKLMSARATA